jgi:uncharacterized protein YdhG (YjbR/CyaY superfamily)
MAMSRAIPKNIAAYVDRFPKHVQRLLQQMRRTIRAAAPHAKETISYRMPAFRLDRILVYFAAHKNHIGFYPGAAAIARFRKQLSAYKGAKGSIQFPVDAALPLALVRRIVTFRVKQSSSKQTKQQRT